MPPRKRRAVAGITAVTGLVVVALMLRLALEWRQALDDINAMIVTPVILPATPITDPSLANPSSQADSGQASQMSQIALPRISPTLAPPSTAPMPAQLPPSRGQVNILLLGTDERPQDKEPTRTDAMVLVNINRETGRVSLLSLPRDLWVAYPNYGEGRINGAYPLGERTFGPGGGAALAKATVGRLLGLRVDYFVLVNFQGFKTLIDRLGGILVDVPAPLDDTRYPTEDYQTIAVHFDAGPQQMNGERALIYARTRHADNDFGRNQRQQLVLMAIFDRIREQGLLQQLTNIDDYTGALRDYVRTDIPQGVMLDLAAWARNLSASDVRRYAIDSTAVVDVRDPATFAAEPHALRRIVGQFSGEAVSSAGGE